MFHDLFAMIFNDLMLHFGGLISVCFVFLPCGVTFLVLPFPVLSAVKFCYALMIYDE